jgi:hypothetical protein
VSGHGVSQLSMTHKHHTHAQVCTSIRHRFLRRTFLLQCASDSMVMTLVRLKTTAIIDIKAKDFLVIQV